MKDDSCEDGRLHFYFKEFIDEIAMIAKIADQYIDSSRRRVLIELRTSLENLRDYGTGHVHQWGIPESSERTLRTISRKGEYEPGHRLGREIVFAEISSTWSIEPLGPHGPKYAAGRKFALAGNASTRVEIYRCSPQGKHQRVAMWRMELGADDAPGCFFHVQVLGQEKQPPFPKSIPVPRLPTFLATPMVALEFALGELFQDGWAQEASRDSQPNARWREIQRSRLLKLNCWQNNLLQQEKYHGSPWILLKNKKPPRNLFL